MTDDERILSDQTIDDDEKAIEKSMRPHFLKEYIGQDKLKRELEIYIKAAKQREEAMDHVLLFGPPGLGKTTMAFVIANELGVHMRTTSGPAIEKAGDLLSVLSELQVGDVLFIDEIHRLPRAVEETLYSAMEDFYVDIIVGQGPTAHPVHYPLPPFTLIGATTRAGLLSAPLRDRFGILAALNYYEQQDLQEIVLRSAGVLNTKITPEAALEVALRARGTPRVANRLLKRVRDFAEVSDQDEITQELASEALTQLRVDRSGLDQVDRRLLTMMIKLYDGGPVGLKTIAVNIGEDVETVETMYEPFLLQKGFLKRTSRGRMVTKQAYDHLGLPMPEQK
ncbi:ruvB protein [Lapidilactobacillus concavus DSM 17758]|uniref:Holliday junction branch migration complex subunit RuvB n=1 Tax=Lapidilactobacillus concavus DSM 17758 TaxID=1423735 RepID=A0A0R1WDD3_9LACO|nr:Holliday junction branch migration DNA helicase RuvB [Lapidilactobacillus concavus]KRM13643.1 ruvB protein [Lapidilactobacillus concavus DSM 17758]GEL12905.1 Holliday junction ATP-dependent DNA helicase RuvB [Lapidilactobacillus concavus]